MRLDEAVPARERIVAGTGSSPGARVCYPATSSATLELRDRRRPFPLAQDDGVVVRRLDATEFRLPLPQCGDRRARLQGASPADPAPGGGGDTLHDRDVPDRGRDDPRINSGEDLAGYGDRPQPRVEGRGRRLNLLIRAAEGCGNSPAAERARAARAGSEDSTTHRAADAHRGARVVRWNVGIKIDTYRMGEITARLADRVEELESQAFALARVRGVHASDLRRSSSRASSSPSSSSRPDARARPVTHDRHAHVLRSIRHEHEIVRGDRGVALR